MSGQVQAARKVGRPIVRMAKAHTGHEGALVMKFAYHGITDAITALSPRGAVSRRNSTTPIA